jgi:alkylation response protein AidB-like acyl-CoA dehydrogenase
VSVVCRRSAAHTHQRIVRSWQDRRVGFGGVNLRYSPEEDAFRAEARAWLTDRLTGAFASVRGRGGPGDEHALFDERLAWEQELGRARWTCLSFPEEYGGRDATLSQQVIFYEEYARAGGPGRIGIVGEGLIGPTILHFGSDEQKRRFLPKIAAGEEIWCQGYSEPNAGSDLANVQTRAERDGDEWVITGQKIWTSLAHWADWCFVLCRTDRDAPRHRGISYLLVPMRQDGVEIRPIVQLTGTSEFNEVFFDGARTSDANVVGDVNGGWKVAMGTLAFERGASTLGQQLAFENELADVIETAKKNGRASDPLLRQRLADAWIALRVMRYNALRSLTSMVGGAVTPQTAIHKLYWAELHRRLGELAVDVLGPDAAIVSAAPYELSAAQRLFLFTRADTIYGGSNEIQRNVIGERALGLPPEPKVVT